MTGCFYVCVRCGVVKPATRRFFAVNKGHLIRRCRDCDHERLRSYRDANRQKLRESDRARWREKKTDKAWLERRYERRRRYYEAHREEVLEVNERWRAENAEQHRENTRRWAEEHRDRRAENLARWRSENPVRSRNHRRARKARLRSSVGYSANDLAAQFERQHGTCYWCQERLPEKGYHADHVIPLVLGGCNDISNVVVACARCNLKKHAKHPMDFAGVLC